jgi:hypothetical protein
MVLNAYEQERADRIARNAARLAELKLTQVRTHNSRSVS